MTQVKSIPGPSGKTLKFGRKVPLPGTLHPTFKLGRYLQKANLPPPPASCDYTVKAMDGLSKMYKNDVWGDCVIASTCHIQDVFMSNASLPPLIYTDAQVQALYGVCGYNGQASTDQGCDIQTVLNYWKNTGAPAGAHKIAGFLSVDPTNPVECRTAIWLFENLNTGICMPDAWVNPAPMHSGFTWDVAGAPDQNNGHCFPFFGYDADKYIISTWGMTGYVTNAALAKYGVTPSPYYGELYTILSQETIDFASQLAPNGLNWQQLCDDFNSLGGNVTPPVVPPVPPVPVPPVPPVPQPPVPPTPTNLVPGTASWLKAKLAPADYATYVAALSHPTRSNIPGSAYWLAGHFGYYAWVQYVSSFKAVAQGAEPEWGDHPMSPLLHPYPPYWA